MTKDGFVLTDCRANLKLSRLCFVQLRSGSYLFGIDLQQLVHRSAVLLAVKLQPQNVRVPLLLRVAVVPGKLTEVQAKQHMLQDRERVRHKE